MLVLLINSLQLDLNYFFLFSLDFSLICLFSFKLAFAKLEHDMLYGQ